MEGEPCDSSSTISTGSFLTSEILDASPADTGLSSGSTEDQILRESASHPWNSLLPFNMQWRQEIFSGTSGDIEVSSDNVPFQGNYHLGVFLGNVRFQFTKNSFFVTVPAAEFDFPEMERHVASFLHQHFQPLEPSLDLDISSPLSQYNIPQDSREFSKTSRFSRKSEDMTVCVKARGSSLNTHRSSFPSHLETSNSGNTASEQESAKENVT
ncbi:CE295 protein, partial [Crypturellus undulatus]|nr:CE295 protein [Crypturellus undulatus]